MRNTVVAVSVVLPALVALVPVAESNADALILDHTMTDLDQIPSAWIDSVQSVIKVHYAHTSHGGQLTTGLSRIEDSNPSYSVAIGYRTLPTETGALCIFDGQEHDTYITPDEYWETTTGMDYTRDVLDHNPSINVSMWSWCCQLTHYSETQVDAYLAAISTLETEYPDVVFVYMTCNAQATGSSGHNRWLRNEQIRQYCLNNDKVLFDFADLDAWWFNPTSEAWEHSTYEYDGDTVNVEHPEFNGNQSGHTTYESCEQKGRAVWWMLARLAGWTGPSSGAESGGMLLVDFSVDAAPNPFYGETVIRYSAPDKARYSIYDVRGRLVRDLGVVSRGKGELIWEGRDGLGAAVPPGIYFCRSTSERGGGSSQVVKIIRLR
jgi:hypothetical protein